MLNSLKKNNMSNFYETLGVSKTADPKEIKSAYKSLAKKYHPDISKEEDSETKFKAVNDAYDVLSDPEKKSRYDSVGDSRYRHEQNYGGGHSYGYGGFRMNTLQWKDLSFLKKLGLILIIVAIGIFIAAAIILWLLFKLIMIPINLIFGRK